MPYPPELLAAAAATGLTPREVQRLVGDYLLAHGVAHRKDTNSPAAITMRRQLYQSLQEHEDAGRLLYWWWKTTWAVSS